MRGWICRQERLTAGRLRKNCSREERRMYSEGERLGSQKHTRKRGSVKVFVMTLLLCKMQHRKPSLESKDHTTHPAPQPLLAPHFNHVLPGTCSRDHPEVSIGSRADFLKAPVFACSMRYSGCSPFIRPLHFNCPNRWPSSAPSPLERAGARQHTSCSTDQMVKITEIAL